MCNLYSVTRNRDAIAQLFRVERDQTDNQPLLPAVFLEQFAPVVHMGDGGARTMRMMR